MLSRFLELTNYIAALKSRPLDYSVRSRFGDGRSRGSFVSYRSVRFPNSFRSGGKRFILLFWLAFLQRVILFFGFCDKSFRVSVVRRNYRSSLTSRSFMLTRWRQSFAGSDNMAAVAWRWWDFL